MNHEINVLLQEVRERLAEVDAPDPDMHAMDAEPGDLEAENPSEAADDLVKYLERIQDKLLDSFEIDEDTALEFIFSVAGILKDEGLIPPIPKIDDPEVLISEWLGAAKSIGFGAEVFQAAEDIAYDGEED